eukprot:m.138175 g.138175  ORF g.138175 m.138175 type:complete len:87 (+) comp29974_c0_seq1:701-961(+)
MYSLNTRRSHSRRFTSVAGMTSLGLGKEGFSHHVDMVRSTVRIAIVLPVDRYVVGGQLNSKLAIITRRRSITLVQTNVQGGRRRWS